MTRFTVHPLPLVAFLLVGCGGKDATKPADGVTQVVVTASRLTSDAIGDTVRFAAQALNSSGDPVDGATVTWGVTAASVATIASSGLLTTQGNGTVTITASSGNIQGTRTFTVTQVATVVHAVRDSVVIDRWGDTATVAGAAVDRLGAAIAGAVFTVRSSDTAVAGLLTSAAAGGTMRSGRDGLATVTLVSSADTNLKATTKVRVALQRNSACQIPAAPAARGAVLGASSWDAVQIANSTITNPNPTDFVGPLKVGFAVDADGDGDRDVFVAWFFGDHPARTAKNTPAVSVFRNDNGTMVEATTALWGARPATWVYPRVPLVFDVDGDGRDDALILDTGYDPSTFGLGCPQYLSTCTGTKMTLAMSGVGGLTDGAARLTSNPSTSFSHAGDAADIDCDGDNDFMQGTISLQFAPNPSHLQINTGGTFAPDNSRLPPEFPVSASLYGFGFCDIDRDGDADAIYAIRGQHVRIMVNDGFGHFRLLPSTALPAHPGGDATAEFAELRCGDFDGDGWNDLALGRHVGVVQGEAVSILLNNHNATFSDATSMTTTTFGSEVSGYWPFPMVVSDINKDGWPDLMLGTMTAGARIRILYNAGAGKFTEYVFPNDATFFIMSGGTYPVLADFTGDGRPDIFVIRGNNPSYLVVNK